MTCADWRTGGESTLRAAAVSSCCTRHPAGTRGTRPCSHGPAGLRARRRKRPTGGPRGRRLCSLPFGAAYRWELLSRWLCALRTYPPPSICPQRAYGGRVSPAPNAQASGRLHRPAALIDARLDLDRSVMIQKIHRARIHAPARPRCPARRVGGCAGPGRRAAGAGQPRRRPVRGAATRPRARGGVPCAITAEAAAEQIAPHARFSRVEIYVDDPEAWDRALSLTPVPRGGNVLLIRPADRGVFDGVFERDGLSLVSRPQLYVDLVRRGGAAAEAAAFIRERSILWQP